MTPPVLQSSALQPVADLICEYQDFPSPGVLFRDIFPVFHSPTAIELLISHVVSYIKENFPAGDASRVSLVDAVVGLDARGFLLGPAIAVALKCKFAPVRKMGKLPGKTFSVHSKKEYGEDVLEIPSTAVKEGENVVILDDLLATGGTARAAAQLIMGSCKAELKAFVFLVELAALGGRSQLPAAIPVHSLITYP